MGEPGAHPPPASLARIVARPLGAVTIGLAFVMLACAAVGLAFEALGQARPGLDDGAPLTMALSAALTGALGWGMWRWGRPTPSLGRRQAALVVTALWFGVGAAGAVPFLVDAGLSPMDALFESSSGFTTTGSTVITDIEGTLSRPVLLWRSVIQWLGGMGIVVLFVAIFPSLGVGAKHLYRSEVPGHVAEGLQPRITETALILWRIYVGFTVLAGLVYWALGMDAFEAACHALTTLPTGGFSTRDGSIGAFDNPLIELACATLILIGGVNFGLYYLALTRRSVKVALRSYELRAFLAIVFGSILVISAGILPHHDYDVLRALRRGYFFVASTITSTGYGIDDYMAYPSWVVGLMLLLMLIGGSSGSTAGGMKVSRILILGKTAWREIRRAIRPQVVHVVRLDRPALPDSMLIEVAAYFFLFAAILGGGSMLIAFTDGVPMPTAFGTLVTTMANNGPAPFYVGDDNFATYTPVAKGFFIVAMVMGRLELMTVLALLHRDMWR